MQETLYAYLAGTIDADGFITIQKTIPSSGRKDGRRSVYYVAKIGLTETNPVIPDLLCETFGGWRGTHQPPNPRHKRWHLWQATNAKAAAAIMALAPYLRLKRRQAEIALTLCKRIATSAGSRWPEGEAEERARLYEDMSRCNAPGNRRAHALNLP